MRDYQTKSNVGALPDTITATRFGSGEFNSIAVELENAVLTSDQTLAPADGTGESSTQLAQSLAIYGAGGAAYHADTGAVNAYVLNPISPKQSPPDYFDGFLVMFEPGTDNTTASTVNVASLGVKSITYTDGSALTGGELSGTCLIKYNLSDDRFEFLFGTNSNLSNQPVYLIDASQPDQGATSTNPDTLTIYDVATLVGTVKNATARLVHNPVAGAETLYTFDTSLDLSSYPNLFFLIDPGAKVEQNTGNEIWTLYSFENLMINDFQTITSDEMLDFSSPGIITAELMGGGNTGLQYALTLCQNDGAYHLIMRPDANYTITTGLDATNIDNRSFIWEGNNATLIGECTGKPVVDYLGSFETSIRNIRISGDSTNTPSHAIQMGRFEATNNDAPLHIINALSTYGEFSTAAVYNGGSEVNRWDKCIFTNNHATGYSYWADGMNEAHISSDYVTVALAQDTVNSLNENLFLNCAFQQTGGGSAIRIAHANNFNVTNGYSISVGVPAVLIKDTCSNLTLDMHCETSTLERNVEFLTSEGAITIRGFYLKEYYAFGTADVIDCDSASNSVTIVDANIAVMDAFASIPVFGSTGTISIAGRLALGVNSGLHDLSGLTRFNGVIASERVVSDITIPSSNTTAIVESVAESMLYLLKSMRLFLSDGSGSPTLHFANDTTNKFGYIQYDDTGDLFVFQGGAYGGTTRPMVFQAGGGHVLIATTTDGASNLRVAGLATYADNAAALVGGLTAGDFYRTATGTVQVVF